jgi:hypothetical protein
MSKITTILTHKVGNYDNWRKAFDAGETHRQHFGINIKQVLVSEADHNEVTVIAEGDADSFDNFMKDPNSQAAMKEAGVTSPPAILKLVSRS